MVFYFSVLFNGLLQALPVVLISLLLTIFIWRQFSKRLLGFYKIFAVLIAAIWCGLYWHYSGISATSGKSTLMFFIISMFVINGFYYIKSRPSKK
jgi:hypothetical protein